MPSRTPPVDPSARWSCPDCTFKHEPGSQCPRPARWAGGGTAARPGLAWIIRPMPPDQWPPEQHLPRDNTFRWWVKASCGHPGGHRQFAFYEKRYADEYEWVFRENPCYWTRCRSRRG